MDQEKNINKLNGQGATPFTQTYFHGTRADLKIGDPIEVGFNSNYGQKKNAKYSQQPDRPVESMMWKNKF